MADMVEFELVSPQRLVLTESVEMVVIPCVEGDIGVLPGHSPLIATVRPGFIDIHVGNKVRERIFVGGGFVEVSAERCTVLAEEALLTTELNRADAEARLEDARKRRADATEHEIEEADKHLNLAEELMAAVEYIERT